MCNKYQIATYFFKLHQNFVPFRIYLAGENIIHLISAKLHANTHILHSQRNYTVKMAILKHL
jgi:hypothetical protein